MPMLAEALPAPDAPLSDLLATLSRFETVFEAWDEDRRAAALGYARAVENLHAAALRKLIAACARDPAAAAKLKEAAGDETVYAILRRHGLLKPSLNERIEEALDTVRPQLAAHGGDVALVRLAPPLAELRFSGSCDGCSASQLTFQAGVRKALRDACPEITDIRQAKGPGLSGAAFESPFAREEEWLPACRPEEIADGGVRGLMLGGAPILLWRSGAAIACYADACAHMGFKLSDGDVTGATIACAHHGFEFDLAGGACLTAPELALEKREWRLADGRIEVRLA